LSNLDAELRARTRGEIKDLQRELGTTMIYVTHDQVEATTMGDRIAVLRGGKLEQIGAPQDVYRSPATAFVARFLGMPPMNLFPAGLLAGNGSWFGVRPEHISLTGVSEGRLRGQVVAVEPLGSEGLVHVQVEDSRIIVREPWESVPNAGSEVGLGFGDGDLHVFEDRDGKAIT
jgi:multiple sugar transport system ATP-binding protein